MKHLSRLFLVLVFTGCMPLLFIDCNPCKCGDPGPDLVFVADSMELHTWFETGNPDSVDYTPYDSVWLTLSTTGLTRLSVSEPTNTSPFLFIQTANACECVPPNHIVQNYISAINIVSEMDTVYSNGIELKKGVSMTNCFKIKADYYEHPVSIPVFLKTYKKPNYEDRTQYFQLTTKPQNPIRLVFTVEIKLNNGKLFIFKNQVLKVK